MGKGDKKTKRGKINLGSHGNLRPSRRNKEKALETKTVSETPTETEKA